MVRTFGILAGPIWTSALLVSIFSFNCPALMGLSIDPPAPGLRDPDIRIELRSHAEAYVGPEDDGIVQSPGTVYCEMPLGTPPGQYCIVYLTVYCEGWPASTSSALTFDHNNTVQSFQVVIRAPPGTTAGGGYTITVSGRWEYSPGQSSGNIEPAHSTITVNPYSHLVLTASARSAETPVGENVNFKAQLKNNGNSAEKVSIYCICPAHVDAEIDLGEGDNGPDIMVDEGSVVLIDILVKQNKGLPGNRTVSLHAKGTYTGNYSRVNLTFYLTTTMSPTTFITSPHFWIGSILLMAIIGMVTLVVVLKFRKKRRYGRSKGSY